MIVLKFATTIKGECDEDAHKDWINVDSCQFGVGRSISSVGGGADRDTSNPSFSELTLSRAMDKASQELMLQACGGKSLGKAEIHFIQTGGDKNQVYFEVELSECLISSYSVSSGGDRPSESISLNFTQLKTKYSAFTGGVVAAGALKGWDLLKNKKL